MDKSELIAVRRRFKWSRPRLARKLGCSIKSIYNWESEKNPIPKYIGMAISAVIYDLPEYKPQLTEQEQI